MTDRERLDWCFWTLEMTTTGWGRYQGVFDRADDGVFWAALPIYDGEREAPDLWNRQDDGL